MFVASQRSLLFDYFRVPYCLEEAPGPLVRVTAEKTGRSLSWPASRADCAVHRWEGTPFCAALTSDRDLAAVLAAGNGDWQPVAAVEDLRGRPAGSVWRDAAGSVVLPFNPDDAMRHCWSESYTLASTSALVRHVTGFARRVYYRLRPLMPRSVQIAQRRAFSRVQSRTSFPSWPVETALHDMYDQLLALFTEIAGEPVPQLAPWPAGYSWAFVLTHDVETAGGIRAMGALRRIEERLGLRSSWNMVGGRYPVDDALVDDLHGSGFEVGVHGLHHDGRDLESAALLAERLPAMRANAEHWGACGFRSPATQRAWDLMPMLGFDYDSSYPDTDPYEPQAGGCCTWLPFFNGDLVELPMTLPQDHTLFTILRQRDETTWVRKAEALRARGGMALINTHPDYTTEGPLVTAYAAYLEHFAADTTAWRALPRDVSSWWRRRAASVPVRENGGWTVAGPAAGEGAVQFAKAA